MGSPAVPSSHQHYYHLTRPEMMPFIPQDARRILELGCAEGAFAAQVKAHSGAEVWGIEYNAKAAAQAATVLDRVLVGDADEQIALLPDHYFDAVVCNDVLEHLVNPETTLRLLRDKLTTEGSVVASIPNIRHLPALSKILFGRDFPQEEWGIFDRTHLRFFTRKSIIRLFENAGYAVKRMKGINGFFTPVGFLVALFTLGYFADGYWVQFACVATPAAQSDEVGFRPPPEGNGPQL